jgi:hypothetical protein
MVPAYINSLKIDYTFIPLTLTLSHKGRGKITFDNTLSRKGRGS